ncbi:MAG: hypothetical protein LBL84_03885 [Candidatus Nomurabacteria bacterium]|jgi:hypothetical protein|nr:hypothetical protein [Candidatus Nomurabacteria bacterium]
MSEKGIVIINGQRYDAATGLPIRSEQKSSTTNPAASAVSSGLVHQKTQHATTLNRKYVSKSKAQVASQQTAVDRARLAQFKRRHAAAAAQAQARRTQLASKKHSVALRPLAQGDVVVVKARPAQPKDQPVQHALAVKANQTVQNRKPVVKRHLTATEIKQRDITDAFKRIAESQADAQQEKKAKRRFTRKRLAGVLSGAFAILLLAGYLTYLSVPAISVRIAAIQSGVDVSYPGYKPIGYDMNGLATVRDDSVAMEFSSQGNSYTITQQKSSWDSSAVLDNYVQREWGSNYEVSKERGLTIYRSGGKAAWVNGGVFFRIDGPESLSDQIEKIAISM